VHVLMFMFTLRNEYLFWITSSSPWLGIRNRLRCLHFHQDFFTCLLIINSHAWNKLGLHSFILTMPSEKLFAYIFHVYLIIVLSHQLIKLLFYSLSHLHFLLSHETKIVKRGKVTSTPHFTSTHQLHTHPRTHQILS
jgi:hypothetical protein